MKQLIAIFRCRQYRAAQKIIVAADCAIEDYQKAYGRSERDDRKECLMACFLADRMVRSLPLFRTAWEQMQAIDKGFETLMKEEPALSADFGTIAAWCRGRY